MHPFAGAGVIKAGCSCISFGINAVQGSDSCDCAEKGGEQGASIGRDEGLMECIFEDEELCFDFSDGGMHCIAGINISANKGTLMKN